jgi:hypothetical protein
VKVHAQARLRGLRIRLRRLTDRPDLRDPIVVYQMGKVGSTTVDRSLRALDLPRGIFTAHLLNDLDELERRAREIYPDPTETLSQIAKGRRLRKLILDHPAVTWHVITLVRDPVQRNVSAFFENLTEVVPDVYERRARGEISLVEIRDAFINRYDHNAPLEWFASQLEPVFGIDVFATPFDAARGYGTYEAERASLLLIRLENLTAGGDAAIREFLGLDRFELVTSNVGRQKRYHDLYAEFEQNVTLPERYLARMYESRLARHFYTDTEIETFRQRWAEVP